jgi:hypothetical protein
VLSLFGLLFYLSMFSRFFSFYVNLNDAIVFFGLEYVPFRTLKLINIILLKMFINDGFIYVIFPT